MKPPLLERRSPVGISYALLVLAIFFFLMPSAFRAARLSLGQKENDVKDWLPSDFPETAELEWFGKHFAGDSFILATWPGCYSGDQRLKLLHRKLIHESASYDPSEDFSPKLAAQYSRAKQVGQELQLLITGAQFDNWGGQQEKWLGTPGDQWYYITPDGRLYRWDESVNAPVAALRSLQRKLGRYQLQGQLVTAFGEPSTTARPNPFYNDPTLLCAPLFNTVETGDSIVAELAREGGALWPIDLTDEARRAEVSRRRAMERLTGTLFASAMPSDFDWTAESFRQLAIEAGRTELPEDFEARVGYQLSRIVNDRFGGEIENLVQADSQTRTDVWYRVFDEVEVAPPPRLTCILVTLTETGKSNLPSVIGRGVLGGPRGRLLRLAEDCGIEAAPAPSMAPPPFNRSHVVGSTGRPPLRLGGPPVDNLAIDEEGSITLVRLVGYSVLVGVILSYFCFGSAKVTLMVFVVGGAAATLSMSFVWWTGGRVDAILMSMPSLVYVLGISGAIHVINYYRDEVRLRGIQGASGRALRHALLPCTLASTTTAIGLISLSTSNLAPISNFGLYSAIGVVATLAILFSYLPAALQIFTPGFAKLIAPDTTDPQPSTDDAATSESLSEKAAQVQPAETETRLSRWWAGVGHWVTSYHAIVTVVCLLVLGVASLGLTKIQTSVQLLKLFDSESRIIRDYAWLEENFGKLVPMELIVRVPVTTQAEKLKAGTDAEPGPVAAAQSLNMLERVEAVSRIEKVVRRSLGETGLGVVGQTMSASTFLPPLPPPRNGYWPPRVRFNEGLLEGREKLRQSDYLRIEQTGPYANSELWRISLRVGALSDVDYGQFISTLRRTVEPALRAYDTRDELMRQLATGLDGQPAPVSIRDQVMIIGAERPATLDEVEVLSPAPVPENSTIIRRASKVDIAERIKAHEIYLATLGELLAGEAIRRPAWVDPAVNDRWRQFVSQVDAVVWLGGGDLTRADFADAKRFVDASEFFEKDVNPILVGDRIPDVENSGALQVVYTGVVPVVYKAQRTLLASLVESIGMAFAMITVVMVVLLNPARFPFAWLAPKHFRYGLAAGMISMIPNAFPVLLIFGLMGHSGILVDIGTMMTASVAMGVAVDDTIHFLSWFRSYLDQGFTRKAAVIETYRRVGPAMTQTTIVGGIGLFVFALSTFTPTQRFGTLMLILLSAALVGDLILLPALLAGPIGRFFKPRTGSVPPSPNPDAPKTSDSDPAESDSDEVINQDELPELRVHFSSRRSDQPHRLRRR